MSPRSPLSAVAAASACLSLSLAGCGDSGVELPEPGAGAAAPEGVVSGVGESDDGAASETDELEVVQ